MLKKNLSDTRLCIETNQIYIFVENEKYTRKLILYSNQNINYSQMHYSKYIFKFLVDFIDLKL